MPSAWPAPPPSSAETSCDVQAASACGTGNGSQSQTQSDVAASACACAACCCVTAAMDEERARAVVCNCTMELVYLSQTGLMRCSHRHSTRATEGAVQIRWIICQSALERCHLHTPTQSCCSALLSSVLEGQGHVGIAAALALLQCAARVHRLSVWHGRPGAAMAHVQLALQGGSRHGSTRSCCGLTSSRSVAFLLTRLRPMLRSSCAGEWPGEASGGGSGCTGAGLERSLALPAAESAGAGPAAVVGCGPGCAGGLARLPAPRSTL